jgi:hypothetical protein
MMRGPSIVMPEHGRATDIAAPGGVLQPAVRWLS